MSAKLLVSFAFLFSFQALSQLKSESRIEFDRSESSQIIKTYPVGKKGLIAIEKEAPAERGKPAKFSVTKYSVNFEKLATQEIDIATGLVVSDVISNLDTSTIILFSEDREHLLVKIIETDDLSVTEKSFPKPEGKFDRKILLTTAIDSKIYCAGICNKLPAILMVNYETGEQKVFTVPGENKKRFLGNFQLTEDLQRLVIFQRDGKNMDESTLSIIPMSFDGVFDAPILLDKDPEHSVINGSVCYQPDGTILITGTYSVGRGAMASGFYLARFRDDQQEFIRYYSFTEVKGFFDFLPDNRQKKVERRAAKKEEKGQTDYISVLMVMHPVITGNGFYRLVGEALYPTYRTETTTTYSNGTPVTRNVRVFDGYQYTHAVVIDVDLEGNKISDHCFTMNPWKKPMTAVYFLKINSDKAGNSRMIMVDYKLYSATISADHEISVEEPVSLYEEKEGEKLKYSNISSSEYWYDNYYLIAGSTKVKNETETDRKKKTTVTHYLEKVSF